MPQKQFVKNGKKVRGGNGHTYCGYKTNNNSSYSFSTIFNAAKNLGAYVVTITANEEWDFISQHIINAQGKELNDAIWLGYTKIATPGNNAKYNWITGETTNHVWGNNAHTQIKDKFITNEPQAAKTDKETRCTYILPKSINATRKWSSSPCTTVTNHKNFIIEFNN